MVGYDKSRSWRCNSAGSTGIASTLPSMALTEEEAEMVVRNAKPPFPRKIGDEKWTVIGRGIGGRFLQVIYLVDPDETDFVIHARPNK